jgi:DNA-binding MarR family transcriptional regulator
MTADAVDRIVEQWAHERPELDTTAMEVFGRVIRLARLAGDEVGRVYDRHGIGRPEFDVLATLRRSGPPYQLSPGSLAAAMMMSSGGTTARLDRLEQRGLIRRSADPDDRRGVLVALTEPGRELVDAALTAGLGRQQELLAHVPARPPADPRGSALIGLRAADRDAGTSLLVDAFTRESATCPCARPSLVRVRQLRDELRAELAQYGGRRVVTRRGCARGVGSLPSPQQMLRGRWAARLAYAPWWSGAMR